mmetsp:Transcript_5304/g.5457  ORF Transcript_5304/g.5457 Transcript_5304/m.5457 type:complete len:604 (+) Transcript_5304:114-1925(+)
MRSKKSSLRFTSLLALIINACYMPSQSWWLLFQSEQEHPDILENTSRTGKNLIWVMDEDDGKCLGPSGFGECGDLNLWEVWGSESIYILEHYAAEMENHDGMCLARYSSFGPSSKVGLQSCLKNKAAIWKFSFALGRLSNGNSFSRRCIRRIGNSAVAGSCDAGYTSLTPILHDNRLVSNPAAPHHSSSEYKTRNQKNLQANSDKVSKEWICPETGVIFPINLNDRLKESEVKRQLFMGAGTFVQTVFNMRFKVYTVALYIEAESAYKSEYLAPYRQLNAAQLSLSDDFYKTLSSPADFDRTLVIKLAMDLKKDTLVQGLVHEMYLQPKNKEIIAQSSRKFSEENCPRGLEIIITWRSLARKQDRVESVSSAPDSLEFRINGVLLDTLTEPGIGEDFFVQFMNSDPVSVHAKKRFPEQFPSLLKGVYTHSESHYDPHENSLSPTQQKVSSITPTVTSGTVESVKDETVLSSTISIDNNSNKFGHENRNKQPEILPNLKLNSNKSRYHLDLRNQLFTKFSQDRFLKLKSALAKDIFLSFLVIFYFSVLIQLSLPSVSRRIRYVEGKVVSVVSSMRTKSSVAISRMVHSRSASTSSLPKTYRFIV